MVLDKLVLKLALTFLVLLVSTGCTAVNGGTTTIEPSTMGDYSEDPDSELGSRNNPIALGKPVEVNDWKIQVESVNKDALKVVMASDPYTSKPSAKERYVLLNLKATYLGDESGEPSSDLRFKIVGSKGNTFAQSCGYSSDSFDNNGETFSGASVKGTLCFTVDANQISGATVSVQSDYSGDDRKFISTDSN
jgi:hypothetical protein